MNASNRNEVGALTRLGLSTFLNIGQMAQYRYQYAQEKERQKDSPVQANADKLARNRDKMIKYAGLAVVGIVGLFAISISGLNRR